MNCPFILAKGKIRFFPAFRFSLPWQLLQYVHALKKIDRNKILILSLRNWWKCYRLNTPKIVLINQFYFAFAGELLYFGASFNRS